MASLRTKPNSKFWVACFTDALGRRCQRSTGILISQKASDRSDAVRIAGEYEDAARRKRTARQVREVIEDLHQRITGQSLPVTTLRKYVAEWLAGKTAGSSQATLGFYKACTGKFLKFLGEAADLNIHEISKGHVERFRTHESGVLGLAAKTVNHELKCVKMLFKSARRDGYIIEDPTEFVETMRDRSERVAKKTFTVEELRAVLAKADDEWRSLVLCGLYTGQRLSDVAQLTWSQVDIVKGEIRLTTRKTGKRLVIPIAEPLLAHLKSLPDHSSREAPLHPRAAANWRKTGNSSMLSNQFGAIVAAAGLREKKSHQASHGRGRGVGRDPSGLSFHSLRHTANTMLREAGIPDAVVQALIGHDDRDISDHYTSVGRDALRKAAESLPSLV